MPEVNDFNTIRISLASPEQIRGWSYGEVTMPETINYRTLKPEKGGLFCEKIFGPTKDYECYCGKYKRIRYKGIICDRCGVEIAPSKVRRERMGHIELAAPVAHIWFSKGTPSRLGLLLDLSPRNLDRVIYFSQFIVIEVDEEARKEVIERLRGEMAQALQNCETEEERKGKENEFSLMIEEVEDVHPLMLLTEGRYRELKEKYGDFFRAGIGAEALLEILKKLDIEELHSQLVEEVKSTSGQRGKKAAKRLRVVEAFRRSGNKPEWMILTVLPVLPPELRPMVQLDGGRFATSDLNDLYRRVINRNNRLRKLIELGAPEIIIRNEKRMLQEAVDALIDNGRRGQPVTTGANHKLRSLSEIIRGKQGRFRQNLLGKRVDYSGRSVIVVGPELKLHQCGLSKKMALELFKPFVMKKIIERGLAHNIKGARRLVERAKPEIWDILEEVVKERPVFLNRAPTLHRLGIQAFEVVLVDDSAIHVHPLVCAAFNADFDGDQMAVHVPLSKTAVNECREVMLSSQNMLLPSSGEPTVAPTLDTVLGCYYLTSLQPGAKGEGKAFTNFEEAKLAYELGIVDLRAQIQVKDPEGKRISTSVGRIIFNEALPPQIGFINEVMDKPSLKRITARCIKLLGNEKTSEVLDKIKDLGFHFATLSGITIALSDVEVPDQKDKLLAAAEEEIALKESEYNKGLITEEEKYNSIIRIWNETTDKLTQIISQNLDRYGGIYMMATSGAKGNITQIRQMAGMRGLMTDPSGKIIDFPIRSSFREGLSVLDYFISTHGARKGLADTALRTSDSGYLTRRLIDVAQDVLIAEEDCGTTSGIWVSEPSPEDKGILPPLEQRIIGRIAAQRISHPKTGEVIVERNQEIDEDKASQITAAGIDRVYIRSPLSCVSRRGVCQKCYGRDLGRRRLVEPGTAVGIIAAQSIGEPGTQLTMRTFHTGGVVGLDITSGLPRVEELFEARSPKGEAIVSEIDGVAEIINTPEGKKIKVTSREEYQEGYPLPEGWEVLVAPGDWVDAGTELARPALPSPGEPLIARVTGEVAIRDNEVYISYEEKEEREYPVPPSAHIRISSGDKVKAGDQLTDGHKNPQDILRISGREAVQGYLRDEIQKVYRSQGVEINDKHIEVIIRQMLTRVRIETSGDTGLLPGELLDRFTYEDINAKVLAEGGEPATAVPVLLGITRASLNTDSWLAAASFQETTRVLTEAAVWGKTDRLRGLKENVIIGKLIPAQSLKEPTPSKIALIAQRALKKEKI
jgi:DNA-directed RNA polymerase subunit beta'